MHSVAGEPMCVRGWTAVVEVLAGTSGSEQAGARRSAWKGAPERVRAP